MKFTDIVIRLFI